MAITIDAYDAASARLAGDRSLRVFRALLDAASRPGVVVDARVDNVPPALAAVLALADLDQRVAVLGEPDVAHAGYGGRWSELIASVTGARVIDERSGALGDADMVIARSRLTAVHVDALRAASAFDPERAARLFVACERIAPDISGGGSTPRHSVLTATGPGAPAGTSVAVAGLADEVVTALNGKNANPPAGVDTWLIDADGRHVGLPRTAALTIDTAAEPPAPRIEQEVN